MVVTELKIERYTRSIADGLLVQYDETSSTSPYTGISAVASDSSGDWLVSGHTLVARPIHGWSGYSRRRPGLVQKIPDASIEPCGAMTGGGVFYARLSD